MQCSNLPQGLQADAATLSEPALFMLTGNKYPYNQLYLSYYFSNHYLASRAYLAHAETSCLGLFLKDLSLCPTSSQGSYMGLRPFEKLADLKG